MKKQPIVHKARLRENDPFFANNFFVTIRSKHFRSGDLRICTDPKELNKALKRERNPIPVIEDVLPESSKARVFTNVDARNGYWHVLLDEEQAKLTTFHTPF